MTFRAQAVSCFCRTASTEASARKPRATTAQRRSPEWNGTAQARSSAQARTRKSGVRPPWTANSRENIMDKFPSVEVLSRLQKAPAANMLSASRKGSPQKAVQQEDETFHETCRPAVSDHSGASAHPQTADRGCDRG